MSYLDVLSQFLNFIFIIVLFTMSLTTLTVEELFAEICDLARDQGVGSSEAWDSLVDDVLQSHMDLGELDSEEDVEGIGETLKMKWGDYRRLSATGDGVEEEDVSEDLLDDHAILGQTKDEEEMM